MLAREPERMSRCSSTLALSKPWLGHGLLVNTVLCCDLPIAISSQTCTTLFLNDNGVLASPPPVLH